jgi:hypothetical protein
MRIGAIQSSYVPWRGFFDFIRQVDLFVFYDDVQFSKGSWRNRNKIKTRDGLKWLTVPIKTERLDQLVCDTLINYSEDWHARHLNQFTESYRNAPFFGAAKGLLDEAFGHADASISALNVRLAALICSYLEITTPIRMSTEFGLSGTGTERLIDLVLKTGASTYLSGPSARNYLDERLLRENGICLEYKAYHYLPYPQLWGEFSGAVTVLDLIANCGPQAKNFVPSTVPNEVAIP